MNPKTKRSSLKVFLSHAHSDQDVAKVIHSCVTDAFRGLLEVFRSSASEGSIEIGDSIKEAIKSSLNGCIAAITLLSHSSINRPWINIEFGALWMLDTPIIPVCFPDITPADLPFHFSDIKIGSLRSEEDCSVLVARLHKLVKATFPFDLKKGDVERYGKALHRKVAETLKARLTPTYDEPPLPRRLTVWVLGSYSDLGRRELSIAKKLIPILAKGLVDRRMRLVSGESDMLLELAHHYRDAAIASRTPVPTAIMLSGKLRQRNLKNLFIDAIGVVPDLAIVIGGRVSRGRVAEECAMAKRASIPVLPVPASGGAAATIQATASKAEDLQSLLGNPSGTVDSGDVSKTLLNVLERYIDGDM